MSDRLQVLYQIVMGIAIGLMFISVLERYDKHSKELAKESYHLGYLKGILRGSLDSFYKDSLQFQKIIYPDNSK